MRAETSKLEAELAEVKNELLKKEQLIDTQKLSTTGAIAEDKEESDGLAWTLFMITSTLLVIMVLTVCVLCCYMKSQKQQRQNAREVQERGARGFEPASDLEDKSNYTGFQPQASPDHRTTGVAVVGHLA